MFTFRVRLLALELFRALDLRAGTHDTLNGDTVEFDMLVVSFFLLVAFSLFIYIYIILCRVSQFTKE